jgi:hypothetical protein
VIGQISGFDQESEWVDYRRGKDGAPQRLRIKLGHHATDYLNPVEFVAVDCSRQPHMRSRASTVDDRHWHGLFGASRNLGEWEFDSSLSPGADNHVTYNDVLVAL